MSRFARPFDLRSGAWLRISALASVAQTSPLPTRPPTQPTRPLAQLRAAESGWIRPWGGRGRAGPCGGGRGGAFAGTERGRSGAGVGLAHVGGRQWGGC